MKREVIEEMAMFIGEVIENGYNVEKSLDHIQEKYKLNDVQISNVEELISIWDHEIEDNLHENYEWDDYIELIINALNKRI